MPTSSPPLPRSLTVLCCTELTPHLRRITLGGPELIGFPTSSEGNYIKLMVPDAEGRTCLRTYTVRHHRVEKNELDLDIVQHADGATGPGAEWATAAKPGDEIALRGPGNGTMADATADHIVFVGDLAALPAIAANLEQLPADASGHIVIEVPDEADRITLTRPANMTLQWVVHNASSTPLLNAVQALPWPAGRTFVWAACEFDTMKQLRHHFKTERQLARQDLYISSYWKRGLPEDEHKRVKKQDAESAN